MKATITRTVEEKFEIKLPCFVRTKYHYYKVTAPRVAVQVYADSSPSISIVGANVAFIGEWRYCNAEEFANAFEQAMTIIEGEAYAPVRQEVENDAN